MGRGDGSYWRDAIDNGGIKRLLAQARELSRDTASGFQHNALQGVSGVAPIAARLGPMGRGDGSNWREFFQRGYKIKDLRDPSSSCHQSSVQLSSGARPKIENKGKNGGRGTKTKIKKQPPTLDMQDRIVQNQVHSVLPGIETDFSPKTPPVWGQINPPQKPMGRAKTLETKRAELKLSKEMCSLQNNLHKPNEFARVQYNSGIRFPKPPPSWYGGADSGN
jgi:hypothetical protein